MRYLFTLLLLSLFCTCPGSYLAAQNRALVTGVVHTKSGSVRGKIVVYDYGERVVIIDKSGQRRDLPWDSIKRVSYQENADYTPPPPPAEEPTAKPALATPGRAWYHYVTMAALGGSVNVNNFGSDFPVRVNGFAAAYYHVRAWKRVRYGLGLDYGLLNYQRGESALSPSVLLAIHSSRNNARAGAYANITAGPAYPFLFGEEVDEVTDRNAGYTVQPSLGVVFRPGRSDYNSLYFDLGYRFSSAQFTIVTSTLDVLERRVSYRRISLRSGYRF